MTQVSKGLFFGPQERISQKEFPIRALNGAIKGNRARARRLKAGESQPVRDYRANSVESTRKHAIQRLESRVVNRQASGHARCGLFATNLHVESLILRCSNGYSPLRPCKQGSYISRCTVIALSGAKNRVGRSFPSCRDKPVTCSVTTVRY